MNLPASRPHAGEQRHNGSTKDEQQRRCTSLLSAAPTCPQPRSVHPLCTRPALSPGMVGATLGMKGKKLAGLKPRAVSASAPSQRPGRSSQL
jgi:hypothetical protein